MYEFVEIALEEMEQEKNLFLPITHYNNYCLLSKNEAQQTYMNMFHYQFWIFKLTKIIICYAYKSKSQTDAQRSSILRMK